MSECSIQGDLESRILVMPRLRFCQGLDGPHLHLFTLRVGRSSQLHINADYSRRYAPLFVDRDRLCRAMDQSRVLKATLLRCRLKTI